MVPKALIAPRPLRLKTTKGFHLGIQSEIRISGFLHLSVHIPSQGRGPAGNPRSHTLAAACYRHPYRKGIAGCVLLFAFNHQSPSALPLMVGLSIQYITRSRSHNVGFLALCFEKPVFPRLPPFLFFSFFFPFRARFCRNKKKQQKKKEVSIYLSILF